VSGLLSAPTGGASRRRRTSHANRQLVGDEELVVRIADHSEREGGQAVDLALGLSDDLCLDRGPCSLWDPLGHVSRFRG
jgi:hypothetical protein